METTSTREEPLGERTIQALEEEIAELAAHIHAATCRLLLLIYEFDRNCGWQGWKSCAQWLSWRTGFGLESAREKVRGERAGLRRPPRELPKRILQFLRRCRAAPSPSAAPTLSCFSPTPHSPGR